MKWNDNETLNKCQDKKQTLVTKRYTNTETKRTSTEKREDKLKRLCQHRIYKSVRGVTKKYREVFGTKYSVTRLSDVLKRFRQ